MTLMPVRRRTRGAAASTKGYATNTQAPQPFHGYFYQILTKQGERAHGGAKEYIVRAQKLDYARVSSLERDPLLAERLKRLRTIPGVGPITALTWALEIGDVARFRSIKQAISYCGLCGAEKSSADKMLRTSISKQRMLIPHSPARIFRRTGSAGRTRRPTAVGSACGCPRSQSGNGPLTEELRSCRSSARVPGVVRPKQQRQYASRGYKATQGYGLWDVLGMGTGRR
jgi:hypothetical protein